MSGGPYLVTYTGEDSPTPEIVYGRYPTPEKAKAAVKRLQRQGYGATWQYAPETAEAVR